MNLILLSRQVHNEVWVNELYWTANSLTMCSMWQEIVISSKDLKITFISGCSSIKYLKIFRYRSLHHFKIWQRKKKNLTNFSASVFISLNFLICSFLIMRIFDNLVYRERRDVLEQIQAFKYSRHQISNFSLRHFSSRS